MTIAEQLEMKQPLIYNFLIDCFELDFDRTQRVDPGYRGKLTLEIVNNSSNILQLHPGMLIGQLVFLEMKKKPDQSYSGKYQDSMGVIGARKEKKAFKKTDIEMTINENAAANDGGFDRDVGSDCEGDGICPVR